MRTFGDDADGTPFALGHCIERVATLPTGVPVEKARLAWRRIQPIRRQPGQEHGRQ
jgi:hypothetical protein